MIRLIQHSLQTKPAQFLSIAHGVFVLFGCILELLVTLLNSDRSDTSQAWLEWDIRPKRSLNIWIVCISYSLL